MKLKRTMLRLLLFFSLLPVCIFGIVSIYETNRKIDDMTQCNLEAVSQNQIASIQNFAKDRKSEMEMVANYQLTKDAVKYSNGTSQTPVDKAYMDSVLRENQKYGTFVASVSVMDSSFHVVGSSEEYEISGISQLKETDEKFHTGRFIIGNVYERQTDDGLKKIVPAYIGIYDGDEIIGYVAEELDTAYFDELRLNMDSLADGTFYLLDGNNTIITAGNTTEQKSLKSFVTNSSERNDFHKKWVAIDHEANPSGEIRYKYGGQNYITYYANVENTDWSIRVTENLSAQEESVKSYSVLIVVILGILAVGVTITEDFMAQRILHPIENIMQTFHHIKETQDYSLRIPVTSNDEVGKMSESINELLEYIEEEKIYEKAMQRKLKDQAENDPLTGIKNKRAIEEKILDMIEVSVETDKRITLGFLDIDDFRDFNTNYGHQTGDEVIRFVAQALKQNIKGEAGRIGGDEFVFCYVGRIEQDEIMKEVEKMLAHLRDGYEEPVSRKKIPVPCSIGIVTSNGGKLDYMELIRKADQAMYEAKKKGKNTFVLMNV